MSDTVPAPPSRKLRRTGAVLLLLAALCYLGTITGWDAHGTTGRIVLAVVGVPLLVVGLVLARTKVPAVRTIHADTAGLTITVDGSAPVSLPWSEVDSIWVRRLDPVMGGHLLLFRYSAAHRPGRSPLRPFEHPTADGGTEVLIGLDSRQARALIPTIGAAAGSRYRSA